MTKRVTVNGIEFIVSIDADMLAFWVSLPDTGINIIEIIHPAIVEKMEREVYRLMKEALREEIGVL